jgi:hypothetical protein
MLYKHVVSAVFSFSNGWHKNGETFDIYLIIVVFRTPALISLCFSWVGPLSAVIISYYVYKKKYLYKNLLTMEIPFGWRFNVCRRCGLYRTEATCK